ncbi:MAG: NAD(P)H-dependent oxidoreductase [Flavobacteriales bacterium]
MSLIDNLNWRYATKKFDSEKVIAPEQLALLKEAVRLSASSYGLQLYKVLVINNPEVLEQLKPLCWGQSQITDASHVFVFCNYTTAEEKHIDEYINLKSTVQNIPAEDLKPYADFMKGAISKTTSEEQSIWNKGQTYIALTNLMNMSAELNIDTCPMEGFQPKEVSDLLGLTERGLKAALLCPVGYRSEEDQTQHMPKVRKSTEELFEEV